MISVYVETNFLLEIAAGQEQAQSALALLELAETKQLALFYPDVIIAESFSSLAHRGAERAVYFERYAKPHLTQLLRAKRDKLIADKLLDMEGTLRNLHAARTSLLETTVSRMIACAGGIHTDANLFADAMIQRVNHDLQMNDAIVFASVLARLNAYPIPHSSFFVTRDADDFAKFKGILLQKSCRFIASFNGALAAVRSELSKPQ